MKNVSCQADLVALSNLFLIEHNRIARVLFDTLKEVIPDAKQRDELVYQVRKIIQQLMVQY